MKLLYIFTLQGFLLHYVTGVSHKKLFYCIISSNIYNIIYDLQLSYAMTRLKLY